MDFIKEKLRNVWKGKEVKEPAYQGSDKEITKKHILCSLNFMSNRFNSICNVVVEIQSMKTNINNMSESLALNHIE